MAIFSLGFAAGFIVAMVVYERERLMGWLSTAWTYFINQWQKVTKKG
jgi:hypothetical protein